MQLHTVRNELRKTCVSVLLQLQGKSCCQKTGKFPEPFSGVIWGRVYVLNFEYQTPTSISVTNT